MATLTRELRRSLESTVRAARRAAEAGAHKVIEQLAVHHHEPWPSMTPAQRELRNRLRAHGRQLGDRRDERRGVQAIDHLTTECAYEHWHRMLFARFLAETELLIEPESGVAISLVECQELARPSGRDWLELAADYAQRMLPQIFRTGDPVLEVALPPETRSALEDLMKALPGEVFLAEDSLGWVYQYWQADRKEAINHSEKKIGASELPAVTQLFTEDYMVLFLLHNTLGAWWAGKALADNPALAESASNENELRVACAVGDVEWTYLRFVRDGENHWRPAAGTFKGWPTAAKDITLLDPCMGSGHFLVFALPMVAAMRAKEEGMSPEMAILAVLRDNLFGLEIDPRCTQIAAFNLALAAWRRVVYRALPALHLACSGLSLGMNKVEWLKLAERASSGLPASSRIDASQNVQNVLSDSMKRGFERLHDLFARAPSLGSLIEPRDQRGDLLEHGFGDLEHILSQMMTRSDGADLAEMAVAAQGLGKAAEVLARRFTLVVTNVPYLGRGKQDDVLMDFCDQKHPLAKANLATAFVERVVRFCDVKGTCAVVTPHDWLFLGTYKRLRYRLLSDVQWVLVVQLGSNAFQDMNWWAAKTLMVVLTISQPVEEHAVAAIDVSGDHLPTEKAESLTKVNVLRTSQARQLANPDATLMLDSFGTVSHWLFEYVDVFQGVGTTDLPRYVLQFWELAILDADWESYQFAPVSNGISGMSGALHWERGQGELATIGTARKGLRAKERMGFGVSVTGHLYRTMFFGSRFDNTLAVLVPKNVENFDAVGAFFFGEEYIPLVRRVDQALSVTESSFLKVPFDLAHWQKIAKERYPKGLPKPHSADPTQWLFDGHPKGADFSLQVAVARLVGCRWPRLMGSSFPDCPALASDGLEKHADRDGIVTLSPVKGEQPGAGRLTALLADAFYGEWSAAKLDNLLAQAGFTGRSLDDWLRDDFFEQHCAIFHQRPNVWHIWDGRRDGFHALVNYHRLAAPNGEGRRTLEKLLYTYLGDWIDRQRADQKAGVEGADARVAAAEQLKTELTNILGGEPPYDVFVRWKPLAKQSLGWAPDINDGVRMNIRPFVAAKPLGARGKGACILRATPKIKWEKDRGKEPKRPREDFPWFWGWDERTENFEGTKTFDGSRWTDLHYSRSFKEAARARSKK